MLDYTPEIESLTSEDLLSIVLAMVAPAESDPLQELGLRFDASGPRPSSTAGRRTRGARRLPAR